MPILSKLNKRVRARVEEDDFEHFSQESASDGSELGEEDEEETDDSDGSTSESDDGSGRDGDESENEDLESDSASDANSDITSSLNNISFGALAKAQASLGKRKRSTTLTADIASKRPKGPSRSPPAPSSKEDQKYPNATKPPQKLSHRTSKHAPTIQSSRHAVTRKRTVIETPAIPQARDPRFDSVVLNHSTNGNPSIATNATIHASKNYAFLNSYRTEELSQLRKRLQNLQREKSKDTHDEREIERLKRQITSMSDRMQTFERKEMEREVLAGHRRKEREAIREGKKSQPWFLKKGDVKREVVTRRFTEMSGKEKQRALERRRKKIASKEKKEMPWARRGVE
ncbi:rRNA biogenesis protein RRP36 [Paracoccidioides brasiliensis]|uniref:rRNA biogenesis protein RRP36 n=1 Tax=Paracoccidioides brasiliensis TaxID=121759 RepID=A0A1D2JNI5_PARBR|nr:rRNA biogenesis protein RRP36 [Paracoccidioides brasiliensis]ODH49978.1 rRNA biogenesis protein RRP36 [Paracoccidioides brasiliensis]